MHLVTDHVWDRASLMPAHRNSPVHCEDRPCMGCKYCVTAMRVAATVRQRALHVSTARAISLPLAKPVQSWLDGGLATCWSLVSYDDQRLRSSDLQMGQIVPCCSPSHPG